METLHRILTVRITTIFLSISLAGSSSSFRTQSRSVRATPSDLLSILGPASQSSKVAPSIFRDLTACLRFIVPFTPTHCPSWDNGNDLSSYQNELVWFPPEPVLELARLAVDSGGDPEVIHRAIDPTVFPVPDVEECKENRCELTRTPYGRRFINKELNTYLEFLFQLIVDRGPEIGLNLSLTRYDFFHGHLFLAIETSRLGILFHAKEYPAFEEKLFPYDMGFCQKGSNVNYDDSMNLRNIIWLAPLPSATYSTVWEAPGVLVVLDAHPEGIIYRDLIPDYVKFVRTIYEDDFGVVAADVNYLNVGYISPNYQIFIC